LGFEDSLNDITCSTCLKPSVRTPVILSRQHPILEIGYTPGLQVTSVKSTKMGAKAVEHQPCKCEGVANMKTSSNPSTLPPKKSETKSVKMGLRV
jgi:hypothetical protein